MSLSSRDSEPGFGTPPRGELLLILVKFLGTEQVPLSVLKKTRCSRGLCLLALIIPAVAFILAGPVTLSRKSSPWGGWHIPAVEMFSQIPWWLPVLAVAGTGGRLKQLWVSVLVSPLCSSAPAWPVLAACGHSFPAVPGWQLLGDAPGAQTLGSCASFGARLCLSCALTRGHCTTRRSLINNLLTCLAALCSVACFTTLPGVLECWFPWQPDIAFLFFITITVLLLPCSNALSSLFCLGVCVRATNLFLKIILLNHLVNLEKG